MVSGTGSSTDDLLAAAGDGSVRAIARLLSRIESGGDRAADVARALVGRPRHATIIGCHRTTRGRKVHPVQCA